MPVLPQVAGQVTNAEASLGPNQQANLQQLLQSRHLLQGASTQTQINTLADIGSANVANYAAYPKHAWDNVPAGATDFVESEAQARLIFPPLRCKAQSCRSQFRSELNPAQSCAAVYFSRSNRLDLIVITFVCLTWRMSSHRLLARWPTRSSLWARTSRRTCSSCCRAATCCRAPRPRRT